MQNIPLTTLAFIGNIGWPEITILALLGVLIFGRRLPEVGRSIGKSIVAFKQGLSGIEDQADINKSIEDHPVSEKGQLDKDRSDSTKVSQPTPTEHTKDS